MIAFLVDGEWCRPDFAARQAPAVVGRGDDYWAELHFLALGMLVVTHPHHGSISIVPKYFPWRLK